MATEATSPNGSIPIGNGPPATARDYHKPHPHGYETLSEGQKLHAEVMQLSLPEVCAALCLKSVSSIFPLLHSGRIRARRAFRGGDLFISVAELFRYLDTWHPVYDPGKIKRVDKKFRFRRGAGRPQSRYSAEHLKQHLEKDKEPLTPHA